MTSHLTLRAVMHDLNVYHPRVDIPFHIKRIARPQLTRTPSHSEEDVKASSSHPSEINCDGSENATVGSESNCSCMSVRGHTDS